MYVIISVISIDQIAQILTGHHLTGRLGGPALAAHLCLSPIPVCHGKDAQISIGVCRRVR